MKKAIVSSCFMLSIAATAQAAEREGLYLGLGLGLDSEIIDIYENGERVDSDSQTGYQTTIKVGAYVHPQMALYYLRQGNGSFDRPYRDAQVSVLNAIGATYYMSHIRFSPYIDGGIGVASLSGPGDDGYGMGTMFGLGLEMGPKFQMGIAFSRNATENESNADEETERYSVALKMEAKIH